MVQQNDVHASQGPPPKRTKIVPERRSQSIKVPSINLKQVQEHGGDDGGIEYRRSTSQLSTPPDSGKRMKSRIGSVPTKVNQKNKTLFPNLVITKPASADLKGRCQTLVTEPIRSYQGFTTTEEKVKGATIGLSKTTLEKLSAFRYKPSLDSLSISSQPPFSETPEDVEIASLIEGQRLKEVPTSSCSQMSVSDSFFKQALWHEGEVASQGHQESTLISHLPINLSTVAGEEDETPYCAASSNEKPQGGTPKKSAFALQTLSQKSQRRLPSVNVSQHPTYSTKALEGGANIDELSYSEISILQSEEITLDNEPHDIHRRALDLAIYSNPRTGELEPISSFSLGGTLQNASTVGEAPKIDTRTRTPHQIRAEQIESHNTAPVSKTGDISSICRVAAESSDLDECMLIPHCGKDLPDSDDFDDGLSDEDLLALVTTIVVPQAPSQPVKLSPRESVDNAGKDIAILQDPSLHRQHASATGIHFVTESSYISEDHRISESILSPQILGLESDDEFPIEDQDEYDMLMLPDNCNAVDKGSILASIQATLHDSLEQENGLPISPESLNNAAQTIPNSSANHSPIQQLDDDVMLVEDEEDWSFMHANRVPQKKIQIRSDSFMERENQPSATEHSSSSLLKKSAVTQTSPASALHFLYDSHEYEPLQPFVRPPFTSPVRDRCPVIGLSAQTLLRTCFRIGEMFQVGAKCNGSGLDAVIELFARVNFSSRESGTTKQHFQFLDLWHDRPPFPNGILASFKTTGLAESESKVFLLSGEKKIARVLGKLKRDGKKGGLWKLVIINIRETDWEEIRWTRRIVSGDDLVKKEQGLHALRP